LRRSDILLKIIRMQHHAISLEQARHFRGQVQQRDKDCTAPLSQLIAALDKPEPVEVPVCLELHDAFLFLLAYPANARERQLTEQGLSILKKHTRQTMQTGTRREQLLLSGSGLPGTLLSCQFSLPITRWLTEKFPGAVSYDAAAGDAHAGAAILHQLFPRIEYACTTQGAKTLDARLRSLTGKTDPLLPLLQAFEQAAGDESLREILFDQLQVFTSWELNDAGFNRSDLRGIPFPVFYHKKMMRKTDAVEYAMANNPVEATLSPVQQEHLLDAARASLAFYTRETEPITLAGSRDIRLFNCGRGLFIALYGIKKERRLSLESYIGYMAFKNNIPVAYGGGWIFGERCKIGLNIYPPFRKGESALLFASLLALYRHVFRIQRFVVMPYQFGKGNPEGIESAAFWFYYKLGFRPQDESISKLAGAEFTSGRRSDTALLKKFTVSNLELCLHPHLPGDIDPEGISRRITEMIIRRFAGDRAEAIRSCTQRTIRLLGIGNPESFQPWLNQFSLLLALVDTAENRSAPERRSLRSLLAARKKSEQAYIYQLQQCHGLIRALSE